MADPADLKELIPRTRRAIAGPAGDATLTDDQVLALIADAVAEVVFYTGGLFGHTLIVTGRDTSYNAPNAWAVDPALEDAEATVVVATAALGFFFHEFRDLKVHETITNEGAAWDYDLSANLVLEQMKALRAQRDTALEAVMRAHPVPAVWINLIEARDYVTAHAIEPWLTGAGGQEFGWQ